jgi:hypothetical protein
MNWKQQEAIVGDHPQTKCVFLRTQVDQRVTETLFAAHAVTIDNFSNSLHMIYMVYFDFLFVIDSITVANQLFRDRFIVCCLKNVETS